MNEQRLRELELTVYSMLETLKYHDKTLETQLEINNKIIQKLDSLSYPSNSTKTEQKG